MQLVTLLLLGRERIMSTVPQFSTKLFHHDVADKIFMQEISTLEANIGHKNVFGRIWADSIDQGLALVSQNTQTAAIFYVEETHRDADRDITHWTLLPTRETKRDCAGLTDYKIIIWND